MTHRKRSTSNTNVRGSAETRRRRKRWLLSPEAGFGGDGTTVRCTTPGCTTMLTFATITVDRIVMGIDGGRYTRDNIRPKCAPHNYGEGGKVGNAIRYGRRDTSAPALPGLAVLS
jgi:hypothetical protein